MSSIMCKNGGVTHSHDSVQGVRLCQDNGPVTVQPWQPYVPKQPAAIVAQAQPLRVAPANEAAVPTDRQVAYAKALGADERALAIMTRVQVSSYIQVLKGEPQAATVPTAPAPAKVVVPASSYSPRPVYQLPDHIAAMVRDLPKGYYAWQPDTMTPLSFFRVRDHKTGPKRGQRLIASQHGPNFRDEAVILPSGVVKVFTRNTDWLESCLLGIIVDKFLAAKTYAIEKGRCWHCHLELTDERSRWYGLGPVCEPKVSWYIEQFDQDKGYTFNERPL